MYNSAFEGVHVIETGKAASTASNAGPGNTPPEQLKVFISYSRSDMDLADALVTALQASNYTVFIDRRHLPYGEEWQQILYEYIRDCDTVILLVSERSVGSKWVTWELQQVTELNKRLVPVMVSACPRNDLPPAVQKIEVLPREGIFDLASHYSDLVGALESNRAWVIQATKLLSRMQDWIHAGKKPALLLRGAGLKNAEKWRESKPEKEVVPGEVLDFLLSSRQRANRWLRYSVMGSLTIIGVLMFLLFLVNRFSVKAGQEAAEAQRQANAATAQSAALTSLASNNDAVRGLLLAHEALRRSGNNPSVTTIAAWRNALFRFGPVPLLEAARRGLEPYDVLDGYAPFREKIVRAAKLSENMRWLVASVEENGVHELWRLDLEAKNPASSLRTLDTGLIGWGTDEEVHVFAISKSGRRIAAVQDEYGPGIFVFDLKDDGTYRTSIAKWPAERSRLRVDLRFSDDDQYLLCGKFLWRVAEEGGDVSGKVLPFVDELPPGAFSSDSKQVMLGGLDGKRFKIATWQLPNATATHVRWFSSPEAANVAFPDLPRGGQAADEKNIYSADHRWGTRWGWRPDDGEFVMLVEHLDDAGKPIRKWELRTESLSGPAQLSESLEEKQERIRDGDVTDAAFSKDGRRLATIGKTLLVWDLTAKEPFVHPLVNFWTEGKLVAIDDSGRWVASLGARLQIWDLSLQVPAAFPIDATSILEKMGSFKQEDVDLRFAAGGKWLVAIYHPTLETFIEFWDLRFDNPALDGNLARRNLSQSECDSFFGRDPCLKTFPDQPAKSEDIAAADALARDGKIQEATAAYRKIVDSEPGVKLEPELRAARLGGVYLWAKGEKEVVDHYETGLQLLRQAKEKNPAIPWNADERAGQLWAHRWEGITKQLGAPKESSDPKIINASALLRDLKIVRVRYPRAQFEGQSSRTATSKEGLYEYGLRQLAERARATAKDNYPEAMRLRAVLEREHSRDVPTQAELQQVASKALIDAFQDWQRERGMMNRDQVLERAAALDAELFRRMQPALELVSGFRQLDGYVGPPDAEKIAREMPQFVKNAEIVLSRKDSDSILALIHPQVLNSICWTGTTRYDQARLVLPVCEAAVAGNDMPMYRDSRGVAYAATGYLDKAIVDFEAYLSKDTSNGDARKSRRQWIETLKKCQADPGANKNPFMDPVFLHTIK